MIGAISIGFFAFRYGNRVNKTFLGESINCPTSTHITKPLIIGSILFGIGWGLVGFCPGPAIVAIGAFSLQAVVFSIAMLVGMFIFEGFQRQ